MNNSNQLHKKENILEILLFCSQILLSVIKYFNYLTTNAPTSKNNFETHHTA